jgi:hypothetical protein
MTQTNTQQMTADLTRLLSQVASLPTEEARALISGAVYEAHIEVGCGSRSDLVLACLWMAQEACEAGENDAEDLAGFYEGEAGFDASDHKPDECREWASEYAQAGQAYSKARVAVARAGKALSKRLDEINL